MTANELRIGNWVFDDSYGLHGSPKNIQVMGSFFNGMDVDSVVYGNIKPIPLTEEWLIKFGFGNKSNSSQGSAMHKRGVYLGLLSDGYCFNAESSTNKSCTLKHVHQLQNLYFALTGKELTINQ